MAQLLLATQILLLQYLARLFILANTTLFVITVRNEVAKVMFLHLSVILSTGGSASVHAGISPPPPPSGTRHPPGADTPPQSRHPPEQTPPRADTPQSRHPFWEQAPPWDQAPHPPADGYCCGRYASYWNAFLFIQISHGCF